MAKRRTSGIQRRSRASDEAMTRRITKPRGLALDWRLLLIGAVLVVGAVVLLLVVMFGGGGGPDPNSGIGQRIPDDGRNHIAEGASGAPFTSVPATSGSHWSSADSPGPWGVYPPGQPQPQERMIHNMEHGGIIIWYQASLPAADVATLTSFVNQQITTERFKVILTPWSGADFGHPIAVAAWDWLLYLDKADLDKIKAFIDAHYDNSPEPFGGPAKPGT